MWKDRDPGPLARLDALKADPYALGAIVQRIGSGESLRQICRAWGIPHHATGEWLIEQGRDLVRARGRPALRVLPDRDGLI